VDATPAAPDSAGPSSSGAGVASGCGGSISEESIDSMQGYETTLATNSTDEEPTSSDQSQGSLKADENLPPSSESDLENSDYRVGLNFI